MVHHYGAQLQSWGPDGVRRVPTSKETEQVGSREAGTGQFSC